MLHAYVHDVARVRVRDVAHVRVMLHAYMHDVARVRVHDVAQGVVDENTLVWGQGLYDWLPMKNVKLLLPMIRTPEGVAGWSLCTAGQSSAAARCGGMWLSADLAIGDVAAEFRSTLWWMWQIRSAPSTLVMWQSQSAHWNVAEPTRRSGGSIQSAMASFRI